MDNIFENISLTLILLKIFDFYFFCYLATNEKIAITHLWHAVEPQTMYHLTAKDKVAEQHISHPVGVDGDGGAKVKSDHIKRILAHDFL